ncbi:TetR family transcriptional regulator [Actinophytocola oryzae]|uniref:TetR family transcriptional regulator n=1 Tax=Actinophytocola oryzae TaxID=502181 RepID=A0A4R7VB41_9PSEU|nr:TetR family transcriptional regulator [Actinophytocola oryzae]TDV46230.1 TetR family transcriptional regulator [Actinophytocola oryzae]
MARTGRRPGQTQTREDILAAARDQFAERGYGGATIRGIAAAAGVNPALVHHFFGSKDQVFVAALNLPFNPSVLVDTLLEGPRDRIGERVLRLFLGLWRRQETRAPFLALLRSVSNSPEVAAQMRTFMETAVLSRIAAALELPTLRLTAAASQMMGLAMVRYVLAAEPMASATDDEVVALVAPVIQRYFDP